MASLTRFPDDRDAADPEPRFDNDASEPKLLRARFWSIHSLIGKTLHAVGTGLRK